MLIATSFTKYVQKLMNLNISPQLNPRESRRVAQVQTKVAPTSEYYN